MTKNQRKIIKLFEKNHFPFSAKEIEKMSGLSRQFVTSTIKNWTKAKQDLLKS